MPDDTISIKECRDLREIINSVTAGTMLTRMEYIQIMMVLGSAVERLEREGRVSKE